MKVGDKVIKNPATWVENEFDQWGRGVGVGEIVEVFVESNEMYVDVRWPSGKCYEDMAGLLILQEG